MLKKLEFFKRMYDEGFELPSVQENSSLTEEIRQLLTEYYLKRDLSCIIRSNYSGNGIKEGRNSFSYSCDYTKHLSEKIFLKVNNPGKENKDNLYREYRILSTLYPEFNFIFHDIRFDLGTIEMPLMESLVKKVSLLEAESLWKRTCGTLKLKLFEKDKLYHFMNLLDSALIEADFLYSQQILGDKEERRIYDAVNRLKEYAKKCPHIICHGDYGDANILLANGHPIVIDWEDCFIGIPNYDIIYWLSFFSHRSFYPYYFHGLSFPEKRVSIDIMIVILVIKEAISFYNGEYKRNSLTAIDRINEIIRYYD